MTNSRTLVIGDIHGGLKALQQVLKRAEVTPRDQLIFLGDYVDGWPDTANLIDLLITLKQTHNCIFLKGNHEDLFLDWINYKTENLLWLNNGGRSTLEIYSNLSQETVNQHISFLKDLKLYHIDDNNRLYIHGGFTHLRGIENEFYQDLFYWDRTLWEMAIALDPNLTKEHIRYPKRLRHYNEIFIGHTTVQEIGENTPQNFANIWNVDTGAGFGHKLSILDVDTKQFWQSDNLNTLYTNSGRVFIPRV